MEKFLGKEYTGTMRETFLKDNCEKVENKGYMKPFTPEQLQGHKERLADLSIQIESIEDAQKTAAAEFKATLKPLTKQRSATISNIRQKAEYVNELCYKFVDRETRLTGYYNADGELIEQRQATADELQPTLFSIAGKTGTDNY